MVSWNIPARLVGRKAPSTEASDSSSQQDVTQAPAKETSTITRARRIKFDLRRSTIHPHYRLDDLTDEEYANMWRTAEEFMATKKEYVAVVRKMMKTVGEFQETEDCCPRGLEFKTKDGARRRKRTKQRACSAVLEEQEIQKDEGACDPDFLCGIYKEMTGQSSLEALNRGLKDQTTMLELLDEKDRLKWEQEKASKKGKTFFEIPLRRRTVTETLNGTDMLQMRRTLAA